MRQAALLLLLPTILIAQGNILVVGGAGSSNLADLGAGEGTLSQLMAQRAKKVIAIDNSEKMVEFGRELARRHGIGNLEYRQGDLEEVTIRSSTVDLVLNCVN